MEDSKQNAQNLHLLNDLEIRTNFEGQRGLNLTRATTDAILKYKAPYSKVDRKKPLDDWKFYYDDDAEVVKWASKGSTVFGARSFECEIMDWADDIAYSTHDLKDGIQTGMISSAKITGRIEDGVKSRVERKGEEWRARVWEELVDSVERVTGSAKNEYERKSRRKDLIAGLIHKFVTSSRAVRRANGKMASRYQYRLKVEHPQQLKCLMLKSLVWELIIDDEHVATLERRAKRIVASLFDDFTSFTDETTLRMFPSDFTERLEAAKAEEDKFRAACDFIAGMTDRYASRLYSRLVEGDPSPLMDVL